jgi:hypothetical protein
MKALLTTACRTLLGLAAVVVLAVVPMACSLPPAPVLRADVPALGRTWAYRVSDRQGKELGQIVSKIVDQSGNRLTQETTETFNGVSTTKKAMATFQPDGSLLVDDGAGQVSPLPSVRQRLIPGAQWDNPDGTKVTVEGQESVTVPAGTYFAYRLKQVKGTSTVMDWFYPSIGLVKEISDQAVIELMSVGMGNAAPATAPATSAG